MLGSPEKDNLFLKFEFYFSFDAHIYHNIIVNFSTKNLFIMQYGCTFIYDIYVYKRIKLKPKLDNIVSNNRRQ